MKILLLVTSLSLTSCAGVDYRSTSLHAPFDTRWLEKEQLPRVIEHNEMLKKENDRSDRKLDGLRFYQPSPFLLVHSDGRGGLVWTIHHLPDPTKLMTAEPYNYVSTLDATLTFDENFALSDAKVAGDSAAVPKAILDAVVELAPKLIAANMTEKDPSLPSPLLFKIVLDARGVRLVGGDTNPTALNVTIIATPPAEKQK